jgi:hypothetical protein
VVPPAKQKQQPAKTLPKHPKRTNLAFSAGATRSVVYLARNVKPNNDATGFNTSLVYGGARLFRASLEYTNYRTINIAPTWYNIRATTIEFNIHIIARFRNKNAYFYPLFGISYNTFAGKFTGLEDYLNLHTLYSPNQNVVTHWLGFNVGTGYEFYFRPGSFFLEYKMRVGRTEGYNQLNIQDVCISVGLRFNIKAPSIYSIFLQRGPRSRYLLDTSDDD